MHLYDAKILQILRLEYICRKKHMDSQDYLEIKVAVPNEEFGDVVVAVAGDLGFDSFMYEDGTQKCYIQRDSFNQDAFAASMEIVMGLTGQEVSWTVDEMPKVNWNQEWENTGFTPIECGSFVVMPAGGEYEGNLEPVYLKPQMAFGTGHHHTTFMMMETMQDLAAEIAGSSVMDLGCGTAVLAILAAKLGASKVEGIDIDAVAVRSSQENVSLNGLDFPVICGDASDLAADAYDFLLANIHRNIIIADLPVYSKAVRKGGRLLVSGFNPADVDDILAAAETNGFTLYEYEKPAIRTREGWCCISLVNA